MNGIINLKKEAGMTSHDAVFKLRKILGTKKIGHGGTLDPDVVGVLPIAVGKATRMVEFMQDEGKIYEGKSLWAIPRRLRMLVGKWSQKPLFCLPWMKSLLMKRLLA